MDYIIEWKIIALILLHSKSMAEKTNYKIKS